MTDHQTQASIPTTNSLLELTDEEQNRRVDRVSLIAGLISLLVGCLALYYAFIGSAQILVLPAVLSFVAFLGLIALRQNLLVKTSSTKVFILNGLLIIELAVLAVYFSGTALANVAIILVFAILCSATLLEGEKSEALVTISLMAAIFTSLLGTYPPVVQTSAPLLTYFLGAIAVLLAATFTLLVSRRMIVSTLRIKITIAAIGIVLAPLVIQNVIDTTFLEKSLQQQSNQALQNSANMLSSRIDEFIKTNRASVASEALLPIFQDFIVLDQSKRAGSYEEKIVAVAIESFKAGLKVKERAYLTSYAVLDKIGKVIYSSNPAEIGTNERNTDFYIEPIRTGRVFYSPVQFSTEDGLPYLYFSQIIKDEKQSVIGILRTKFDATILQSYAKEYSGSLGEKSNPVIFDENFMRLAEPVNEDWLFTSLMPLDSKKQLALELKHRLPPGQEKQVISTGQEDLAAQLSLYQTSPFFTADLGRDDSIDSIAVVQLTSQPWYITFGQDQQYMRDLIAGQNRLSVIIATLISGSISMLALFIAQSLITPITRLKDTALQVSSGNLTAKVAVDSNDELGILGNAFNGMTIQMQQLITGLEERVRERTQELAARNDSLTLRARQLETIADVAGAVTQAQELESLLKKVTAMISERFGFYHVGIFLLDDQQKYAVLRAANSEGGQKMLQRSHRLEVGQTGIVGYATATGEARIATDVGQDAVYFNNPDLPLTRSEMALPLMVGEQVIGALDVQSTEANAFSDEDIQLFSILADQVAIAIYNNRLYTETNQALAEAQLIHRRYLEQEWRRETSDRRHTSYAYSHIGVAPSEPLDSPDIRSVFASGQPVAEPVNEADGAQSSPAVLGIPIKLRGETIGVIRVKDEQAKDQWTEDEIDSIQAIADQVGLALENARLFNQTSRKAERERKVLEITSKIRSTTNPQEMLQIALEELQQALNTNRAQIILNAATAETNSNGKNGRHTQHAED